MANFTKLLLHCDGTNTSTSFPDSSIYVKTVTANDNAQVSTTLPKFGTGALLLDGSGDFLSSGASTDYVFGTADFTIDCWIKLDTSALADNTIFTTGGSAGTGLFLEYSVSASKLTARINTTDKIVGVNAISKTVWHHIAFVRSGTTLLCFVDGVEEGAGLTDSSNINANTFGINIGREDSNRWFFNGRIDEFRVSKGIARWTSNFTPPSSAYSDPSSTSSSSSSSSCRSSSSSSSSRSSSSSSSKSSSSSSSSSCRSSSSSSLSSSSSCRSSSSSSSSRSSSSSSSSSSCRSSSSSSRSSSSSSRSSSSSSSSTSYTIYRQEGLDKISSTITFEKDKQSEYVSDVDADLTSLFQAVNRGFKPTRVTTSQRNSITNLYPGLIVVNATTNKLNWYTGSGWEQITSA